MRMKARNWTGLLLLACLAPIPPEQVPAADAVDAAYALRIDGQSDHARQQLQTLVAQEPQLAKGWYELARTEFYVMRLEDAQQSIDKALALEPDNADFHYLAGTLAAYRAVLAAKKSDAGDEVGRAMQHWLRELQQTVKLEPQNYRARIELSNAYRQTPPELGGDPAEAETITARLETESRGGGAAARPRAR
ncbi:MAG: tetratricopeptide repeat protein, partial [Pirellulaceae bacterium]